MVDDDDSDTSTVRRGRVHHSAICTTDIDESLRFWRDGLGFEVLMDHVFAGDWPALFDAATRSLRSVFLGDPDDADAGIVELVEFEEVAPTDGASGGRGPAAGFFLLSLYADIDVTLERLAGLGLGGPPRIADVAPNVRMAVIRDPNGVMVELIGTAARQNLTRLAGSA